MLQLDELVASAMAAIDQASNIRDLDHVRIKYLGKKGHFSIKMMTLRNLPPKERPRMGAMINEAKEQIQQALNIRKIDLEKSELNAKIENTIDVSLSGRRIDNGSLHPVTRTIDRLEYFFGTLGFIVAIGLEIEDSYHNFDALNIPSHHPARTKQDSFWFDANRLLRTHTSSIQIRILKTQKPPIRMIAPGRVYRNDYDQTHTPMFHQMEGLVIDKHISFAHLKSMMHELLSNFFEEDLQIRFRPSYFPFTEPSVEVDVMNQNKKWIEVLGGGMVHPNVLRNAIDIDPEIYSGFAFGIGIERLTMLRYGITDLRVFFENDLRFLKQFK